MPQSSLAALTCILKTLKVIVRLQNETFLIIYCCHFKPEVFLQNTKDIVKHVGNRNLLGPLTWTNYVHKTNASEWRLTPDVTLQKTLETH